MNLIHLTDKFEFLGVFLTSTHAPTKRPASRHQTVPRAAHPQEADQKVKLTWVSLFRFSAFEGVHLVFAVRSEDRLRFAPIKPDVIWPLNHHIIAVSHQNSYNFEY